MTPCVSFNLPLRMQSPDVLRKPLCFLAIIIIFPLLGFGQKMSTSTYRDLSIPYIELDTGRYDFAHPLYSDMLSSSSFYPPKNGLYIIASYGHRYLSSRTLKSDNHGGWDFWSTLDYNGTSYSSNSPAPIICMCDGIISQVIHGTDSAMELLGTGRSVQVQCDSSSQVFGDSILINYRHLSLLGNKAFQAFNTTSSVSIQKGDTIGTMGASGHTSNVHLHLSTQAIHPIYGSTFVNTARLFSPHKHPSVLEPLSEAQLKLLHDWPDSALFRIILPYNQTINRIEVENKAFNAVFDFEEAYSTGSAQRDHYNCIPGFRLFAYQFNGKRTAKYRYDLEKSKMPAEYPASPQRDTNLAIYKYMHIPIVYDSVAFVYDIVVHNLPAGHDSSDFVIKMSDVWGYTVEGSWNTIGMKTIDIASKLKLYPNPTADLLHMEFQHMEGPIQIQFFNTSGQTLKSRITTKLNEKFKLSTLPSGIYFVKITASNHHEVLKVIKS